jgi:hypothetical protein
MAPAASKADGRSPQMIPSLPEKISDHLAVDRHALDRPFGDQAGKGRTSRGSVH